MAFKKTKKKDAKKKKKNAKNAKKDDWTHEGGVSIEDSYSSNTDPARFKRIRTQEKDERLRRSRRKHEDQRNKSHFVKKMSKKLNFSEFLAEAQAAEQSAVAETAETVEEKKPLPNPPRSNPLSVTDRLQGLLTRKRAREHDDDDDEDRESHSEREGGADEAEDDDEEEEEEEDAEEEDEEAEAAETQGLVFGATVRSQAVKDHDVPAEHGDDDSDGEQAPTRCSFDWFFRSTLTGIGAKSASAAQTKRPRPQLQRSLSLGDADAALYTAFSPDAPTLSVTPHTVQEIHGLYKLWRSHPAALPLNETSQQLLSALWTYADAFIEGRTHINDAALLETLLMHSLFHVVKSRAKVVKHNEKLKKRAKDQLLKSAAAEDDEHDDNEKEKDALLHKKDKGKKNKAKAKPSALPVADEVSKENHDDDDDVMRDQGFCRPRLLILCPFRSSAKIVVKMLLRILGENTSISGLEKFETEFADPPDSDDEEDELDQDGKKKKKRAPTHRPDDWEALFNGNMDDDFKMGIQVNPGHGKGSGANKGVYMRLFSDFYISDIILASPIGLKLAMESNAAKLNQDFLSSIEQVLVHQADVISMQNWEHIEFVLRHTNQLPKEHREETDFSRVRPYFLDGQGAQHRQLMMTSHFNTPELQAFFRQYAQSRAGQFRLKRNWEGGVIANVAVPVKQTFQLIPSISNAEAEEDARFQYFKQSVLSQILRLKQGRTLIYAPSYLQYVRIRNELIRQEANAVFVCEYSRDSEISRGRARFFQGLKDILVYSGRAHFFRRFKIRGAKHIIFYGPPEYPHFYPELVNTLGGVVEGEDKADLSELSCLTLMSPFDKMALDRVIGTKRADHMINSDKSTFVFF